MATRFLQESEPRRTSSFSVPGASGAGAVRQKLSPYISDPENVTYTTVGSGGDIASMADLNALRAAYENLRVMVEELRDRLVDSHVVSVMLYTFETGKGYEFESGKGSEFGGS